MDWAVYYNIGLVYLTMKVYATAFHYFLTSVKYNPQHAEGYTYLGVCLNKLGEPASAFNAFEKATQIDSGNHQNWLNFAIFLAENSQDASNVELASEKFLKHDEIYKLKPGPKDFQVEQQRMILKNFLSLPG